MGGMHKASALSLLVEITRLAQLVPSDSSDETPDCGKKKFTINSAVQSAIDADEHQQPWENKRLRAVHDRTQSMRRISQVLRTDAWPAVYCWEVSWAVMSGCLGFRLASEKFRKMLASESGQDAISEAIREFVGPLGHSRGGYSNSLGSGCDRSTKKLYGASFKHGQ